MNKWEISRRDLLKSLGVGGACLPLLQATTSYGQPAEAPKRLIVHLQTEGYRRENWLPPAGPLGTLPSSLQPLEEFKDQLIVMADLTNPKFPGCARWAHGSYGGIFAAGPVDPNSGNGKEYWEPVVPSIDQIVASDIEKKFPQITQKTLAFGIGTGNTGRYPGSNRCFWAGPKQPITPETDPYKVYNQIFAGRPKDMAAADPNADKMRAERKSLLDFVGKDLERFKTRLGMEDRMVIDGHLESIRQLERKLSADKQEVGNCGGVWSGNPAQPVAITTANTPMLWSLQMQLVVAALKCDVTRVGTTQVGDSTGGAIIFDFVPGVPREGNGYQKFRDWHDLGHRPVRPGPDGDDKSRVDKWTMGKFAELLGYLKKVPEGGGTMLDSTVVLWANHMEDGSSHGAQKMPWIIAGKSKGYFKTGHCFPAPNRAINGPLMEIATAMGVKLDHFGDPALGKPMPELRA
jgi:Protein of unknown function (DUF1552)